MKNKFKIKKLTIKKTTIAHLDKKEQVLLQGGDYQLVTNVTCDYTCLGNTCHSCQTNMQCVTCGDSCPICPQTV